jgi:hypothetical protein
LFALTFLTNLVARRLARRFQGGTA